MTAATGPDGVTRSQSREVASDAGMRRQLGGHIAGPLLMIGTMLCFVLHDAVLKLLVVRHDGLFLAWGRCLVQALLVGAIAPFIIGRSVLRPHRPGLQLARGCCLALTSITMIVASRTLSLTEIYVIAFASPLVATILATFILNEHATGRQWLLIGLGFLGVLIALRPNAPTAGLILVLPLLQAAGNGTLHVLTRIGTRTEHPLSQLLHVALFGCLLLSLLLPWTWTVMPPADWALLVGAGAIVTIGHFLLIKAFELAPTARVSPMVYFQIIWASLAGYLLFGDVPGLSTLAGAAVIMTSGILLIRSRT